jgi:RNA polymerase sigma-70 factor (ECF subfamily)
MNQIPESDWSLIDKFQKGDVSAFREIFNRHKAHVINLSYRFVQNREAAEDVAQEVFIKIYEKKVSFDPKAKFTTWLYRVTVNASIDRTRRKGFFDKSLNQELADGEGEIKTLQEEISDPKAVSPKEALYNEELKALVQAEIHKLPEKLRAIILLYQFEEMPYREIAQVLGISEKAVERRLYHAKEILRKNLEKELKG